jgi:hypothetical protein
MRYPEGDSSRDINELGLILCSDQTIAARTTPDLVKALGVEALFEQSDETDAASPN